MSLFKWIEGKLEHLDSGASMAPSEDALRLEEVMKEAKALDEQVRTLRSDLRTSRNYAEMQLAVGTMQEKDALIADYEQRLAALSSEVAKKGEQYCNEIDFLRKENSELRSEYEKVLHKLECFQAILESCANAANQSESEDLKVQELRLLLEYVLYRTERHTNVDLSSSLSSARQQLSEVSSAYEAATKEHSATLSENQALISKLKSQLDLQRNSEEALTEARNIEALNDHLQSKQRIIEGLLSEKTMLMLKLDRQTKETLEMLQNAAQEKEKIDSISSLRLFRSRLWLRKPCESIDRCFRWGLDHVRDNPMSRLAVLTYWLTVQLYILIVVMNAGSESGNFLP